VQGAQSNPLFDQLTSTGAIFKRYVFDIKNAVMPILVMGLAGAVVMGLLWIALVRFFAGCLIWLSLLLIQLVLLALTRSGSRRITGATAFGALAMSVPFLGASVAI
jgi:hypothetical protein